jgi:capsular exopolysaccharide synthesis family protein
MARDLVGVVRTTPVLEAAAEAIGEGNTAANLRDRISADRSLNIVTITGTDRDPTQAVILADAVAAAFIAVSRAQRLEQQRLLVEEVALAVAAFEQHDIAIDSEVLADQITLLSTLQLIEAAVEPGSPLPNDAARNVLLAMVLAVIVAAGIVALLELLDERVSTVQRFRGSTDALPVFALVPRQRVNALNALLSARDLSTSVPYQESIRALVAGVRLASQGPGDVRTVLVTSALPGEGKSTIAVALAITHAQTGQSVILVDANLRSPGVGQQLGAPDGPGLAAVVAGESTLADALCTTDVPGLSVLPAGVAPADPTTVVASERMPQVLTELAGQATVVVIDSPAVLPYADAAILASIADATVLVVDASATNANDVQNATRILTQAKPAIIGGVLNKVASPGGRYYHGSSRR